MAETPAGQAGRASGGASQRLSTPPQNVGAAQARHERVWYPLHRCPECGSYSRIIRRPTGEVYLACIDRIDPSTLVRLGLRPRSPSLRIVVSEQSESNHECGYQETLA